MAFNLSLEFLLGWLMAKKKSSLVGPIKIPAFPQKKKIFLRP